ncbi:DNA-binding CsgD family transcriptional regulator [Marmoricola sp. URHA0025 HA25]
MDGILKDVRRVDAMPALALSGRERDVLALMAQGRSNAAVAETLVVSARTVESHITRIYCKLGIHDAPDDHRRVLAVLAALRDDHAFRAHCLEVPSSTTSPEEAWLPSATSRVTVSSGKSCGPTPAHSTTLRPSLNVPIGTSEPAASFSQAS